VTDTATSSPAGTPLPSSAAEVLAGLTARPLGETSPSIYDTGRVNTLAPWLPNAGGRLRFLMSAQKSDGTWGGPDGYAVIPTLSAVEALLNAGCREDVSAAEQGRLAGAAHRGLSALWSLLHRNDPARLPDTVAAELIAPALTAEVNAHLDRLASSPVSGLDAWSGGARLERPPGSAPQSLAKAREHLRVSGNAPVKLWHSLEVMGDLARAARSVVPAGGAVSCSPAATAAWLGSPPMDEPASIAYLESAGADHGGALPGIFPLYGFERIWVIATLLGAGLDVSVSGSLVTQLETTLDAGAMGGAPGLPPDADTTSAALATLARLGRPRDPARLWEFELDDHFCCWVGERTPSPTANAHVLEAFAEHVARASGDTGRHRAAIVKIVRWLADAQRQDGSWTDKWHASAYYATAHCALALDLVDRDDVVRRAVEWTLATQNADGSWGRWGGTSEETAYAIHILLRTRPGRADLRTRRAAARGHAFMRAEDPERHPALWQDKELYAPLAICRAVRLAALHIAQAARLPEWE